MTITALPTPPSRANPTTFSTLADAFIAALPVFVTETNAVAVAMDLNDTTSNSTTSLTISVASKSLTVNVSKSYQPGMSVKIARTASPSNWMHGDVTSYNAGTGALVVNVLDILGSGTYTDWTITFSAPNLPFANVAEINTGTEAAKAIPPDQLALSSYALQRVPVGAMITWPTETPPAGWLERDGTSLSRTTYANLFGIIGTTYGAVDADHFNIPDHCGKFPRYWAHGSANDPDRAARTAVTTAGATMIAGDHVGTEQAGEFVAHAHTTTYSCLNTSANTGINVPGGGSYGFSTSPTNSLGGNETRPDNEYEMPIIKY